jgi:aminoglycoside phosphotransferase (APT) family kinase protein
MSPDQLTALLNTELGESLAGKVPGEQVTQLERLSGGANNETWRLMWGSTSLILRRRPFSADSIDQLEGNILGLSLVDEAAVIQLATSTSVPVPEIHAVFDATHPIGEAFLMGFIRARAFPRNGWLTILMRWLGAGWLFSVAKRSGAFTALTAQNFRPILVPLR